MLMILKFTHVSVTKHFVWVFHVEKHICCGAQMCTTQENLELIPAVVVDVGCHIKSKSSFTAATVLKTICRSVTGGFASF